MNLLFSPAWVQDLLDFAKEYSLDFVENGNGNRCFLFPFKIKVEARSIHVRLDTWSQRLLQR